jgi:glycosyl transferase family 87
LVLGFLARALFSRLQTHGLVLQLLSIVPALPYLALEFHYGNVQFFIFALVAAALLCLDERPVLAAFALALAISAKVWPLFFVHYLMVRRRLAVASLALALSAGLTLLPASYFGWHRNASLLQQWASQEFGVAATAGEPAIIGFPSQSVHSVLMRLLATFDPHIIELLWLILALAGCTGLLVLSRRQPQSNNLTIHAVAFCGLLLLQPFTQLGDLVVLFWPITIAVAALHDDANSP